MQPRFRIFTYRISPFTHYIGGVSTAALQGWEIVCSNKDLSVVFPPSGQSEYFATFIEAGLFAERVKCLICHL